MLTILTFDRLAILTFEYCELIEFNRLTKRNFVRAAHRTLALLD